MDKIEKENALSESDKALLKKEVVEGLARGMIALEDVPNLIKAVKMINSA